MIRLATLTGTTAFRTGVVYLALFLLSTGLLAAGLVLVAERSIDQETDVAIAAEISGLNTTYRQRGTQDLIRDIDRRVRSPHRGAIYLLVDKNGAPLTGNLSQWPDKANFNDPFRFTALDPNNSETAISARAFLLDTGARLLVGRTLESRDGFRRAWTRTAAIGLGAAVLLGLAGGVILSRQASRRVEALNRSIDAVRGGALDSRLPLSGAGDEIDRLAARFNTLLTEVEALIRGMRQVTDDVAHDLRTPLQRVQGRLEAAASRLDENDPSAADVAAAQHELATLLRLFRTVLLLNEVESGVPKAAFETLDLAAIAKDAADLYGPVFEAAGTAFELDLPPTANARGQPALLAQAVANLLDNATKYAPAESSVRLELGRDGMDWRLSVADRGPGIPETDRERVRARFVRLDRARNSEGHGLGLALVDAVARLHQGRLELADNAPGLRATLRLPACEDEAVAHA